MICFLKSVLCLEICMCRHEKFALFFGLYSRVWVNQNYLLLMDI